VGCFGNRPKNGDEEEWRQTDASLLCLAPLFFLCLPTQAEAFLQSCLLKNRTEGPASSRPFPTAVLSRNRAALPVSGPPLE
jgi:hypothetical protein